MMATRREQHVKNAIRRALFCRRHEGGNDSISDDDGGRPKKGSGRAMDRPTDRRRDRHSERPRVVDWSASSTSTPCCVGLSVLDAVQVKVGVAVDVVVLVLVVVIRSSSSSFSSSSSRRHVTASVVVRRRRRCVFGCYCPSCFHCCRRSFSLKAFVVAWHGIGRHLVSLS